MWIWISFAKTGSKTIRQYRQTIFSRSSRHTRRTIYSNSANISNSASMAINSSSRTSRIHVILNIRISPVGSGFHPRPPDIHISNTRNISRTRRPIHPHTSRHTRVRSGRRER